MKITPLLYYDQQHQKVWVSRQGYKTIWEAVDLNLQLCLPAGGLRVGSHDAESVGSRGSGQLNAQESPRW